MLKTKQARSMKFTLAVLFLLVAFFYVVGLTRFGG